MLSCRNAEIVFRSKFLTSRTKGHFRTNFARVIYLFIYFCFYRIFHLFLRPQNIISTSFHEKMVTLHSGRNSWPIGTRVIFVQIFHEFFFLFKEFSIFFLDQKNMLSISFGAKMTILYSIRNSWLVEQ